MQEHTVQTRVPCPRMPAKQRDGSVDANFQTITDKRRDGKERPNVDYPSSGNFISATIPEKSREKTGEFNSKFD